MSIAACAQIVRRGDPDRFLATMAAPAAARQKLFPLYAMNVEVARAPWVTQEPMIAQMRLQWWRDALDEIRAGDQIRAHEVVTPLGKILSEQWVEGLHRLIDARAWDVSRDPFGSIEDLFDHIQVTAGTLAWTASGVLGGETDAARDAGFAQGAAAWLRAVPALINANRFPLPGDATSSAHALAKEGLYRWRRSRQAKVPAQSRPAMLVGFDASLVLKNALNNPGKVMAGGLGPSEFRRRLRLMRLAASGSW